MPVKPNLILTSSFATIANELVEKKLIPENASVAFIPTAADIYKEKPWMERDRHALVDLGYKVMDVGLREANPEGLKKQFALADIIFVAGGNTTYLTVHSHRSGFHGIIRDLLNQGKIYIGSSAGSILAGPTVEPFIEEDLPELPPGFAVPNPTCLGLVDYIVLPHYPKFAKPNDLVAEKYQQRFRFEKMTDNGYLTGTV